MNVPAEFACVVLAAAVLGAGPAFVAVLYAGRAAVRLWSWVGQPAGGKHRT